MQGTQPSLNSQSISLQNDAKVQLTALIDNLQYSLQRRHETVSALSQDALEHLKEQNSQQIEHHLLMLEDEMRLARNDWALLEWLR
ncbi:hypothetical protein [Microscilla marina]|uniref:Uncharacterized protein n=1 Tax=Microscilla marina ATCC 23134 TaxID=313606 RepID=A1ZF58_MICM2|nr:hypothetical protein [Microscilla marina]EAY31160.1 hypothetical protein M23134_07570 [Microscilla marina ATCC 23134]